ncbi:cell envelope integrity protein CreD [Sphingomonas sp. H39-1-10]|uniref:cell envelope integrity protein CreD n=1 Tax=Sphingomonas pollutisoli TaxID=3030829 RepID=UPI0023B958A1|nr:cell envelope integrity protein CreD [Sphingomonas pollutisoli]MDF0486926.1 cell envelope integrity protein CreD [Sphingomonas pollutisoli]
MHDDAQPARTPANTLLLAMLIAAMLAVPLFAVYLLVYDRQAQSRTARDSIAEGWGGAQVIAGPVLAIPYVAQTQETVNEGGKRVTRTASVRRTLLLAPAAEAIDSTLVPQVRRRSIYEMVVYEARNRGSARFSLPADLGRYGVARAALALDHAELRFGVRDSGGLVGVPPTVTVEGQRLTLEPGKGPRETGGSGFFAAVDASALGTQALRVAYAYQVRGNGGIALAPQGGDTAWKVRSSWPSPSFQGDLLPGESRVSAKGFAATWRVGNLALGRASVATDADQAGDAAPVMQARVDLVTPVNVYDQVNRAVKYGFLFIGFTFTAFLMFDLIGGARVSPIELGLIGAGLVLFFVMLLAFAEVTGFAVAYVVAATAIIGLLATYSAAVLGSRTRAGFIAALLAALYGVLYVLIGLEAYALLIGSLLLFAGLASVMYLTRAIDWGPSA